MSERTFFSLRYATPGYAFLLMYIFVAYPGLRDILFQVEDVTLVVAFLAFLSLFGGGAIGFLVSQVWYAIFNWRISGTYDILPKTMASLKTKYKLREKKDHQIVFLDYVHRLSNEKIQTYAQRRYDLIHLCGSTLVSILVGSFFGVFIRIGVFGPGTKLEASLSIPLVIPEITTYDFGVILILVILAFLLYKGLRHAFKEHSMAIDVSVREVMNSGKFSLEKARKTFSEDYFEQEES